MTSAKKPAASTASRTDIETVLGVGRTAGRGRRLFRSVVAIVLVVAAAGLGYVYWSSWDSGSTVRYTTQDVRQGDLTVIVTATGTVEPTNKVDVSSELSGIVRTVNVDFNDKVKSGDALAELDTDKLEAQVAFARATLAASLAKVREAEATVTETKRDFERVSVLSEKQFTSDQAVDAAKAAYERAQAALLSARANADVSRANLALSETDLRKACICSPIDGVVLNRNVDPGQTVASSFQAPVLFTLAEDLTKMQLEADVDEADVGKVRAGQTARFTVDSYPDRHFPAEISEVRYAPETVEGVVTYKAILSIDNSELLLRPGMTATADITVQEFSDVVMIPNAALRFAPTQVQETPRGGLLSYLLPRRPAFRRSPRANADGTRTVWVLRDGAPVAVPITVGASDGSWSEVVEGDLAPGQPVIVDATMPRS